MATRQQSKPRVAFIHPDLGIGGAERLVVDAAIGLKNIGYDVTIYTSHCDKSHCFEEVKNGSLDVAVLGDQLPTSIFGKFFILCATFRQLYLTLNLILTRKIDQHDIFIVDQLSTCVPLLHWFGRESKVLFYCHFPDQLLAKRDGFIKRLYRIPFDILEQFTINFSDAIVVNSAFTKSVFFETFQFLGHDPEVVYPCVNTEEVAIREIDQTFKDKILLKRKDYYLSINRFERKKNIDLALRSFALSGQRKSCALIVAGGYDPRVAENVEYLRELEQLAANLNMKYVHFSYPEYVKGLDSFSFGNMDDFDLIFLTSISSSLKELLLKNTRLLLYTPSNEHFGIVPLEAMKLGVPVLAVNNGGPVETIVDYTKYLDEQSTGWLRPAVPSEWSAVIDESNELLRAKPNIFRNNGPLRVLNNFSLDAMTKRFENTIEILQRKPRRVLLWDNLVTGIVLFGSQYMISFFFSNAIWPYILLSLISLSVFRSKHMAVYWISLIACLQFMNKSPN